MARALLPPALHRPPRAGAGRGRLWSLETRATALGPALAPPPAPLRPSCPRRERWRRQESTPWSLSEHPGPSRRRHGNQHRALRPPAPSVALRVAGRPGHPSAPTPAGPGWPQPPAERARGVPHGPACAASPPRPPPLARAAPGAAGPSGPDGGRGGRGRGRGWGRRGWQARPPLMVVGRPSR